MSFENPTRPDNEGGLSISQAWHAALARAEKAEAELAAERALINWLALRLEKVGWAELELEIESERDDQSDDFGEDFRRAVANAMKVNPC
jgi:hypothetical protein